MAECWYSIPIIASAVALGIMSAFHRLPDANPRFPIPFRDFDKRGRLYQALGTLLIPVLWIVDAVACG